MVALWFAILWVPRDNQGETAFSSRLSRDIEPSGQCNRNARKPRLWPRTCRRHLSGDRSIVHESPPHFRTWRDVGVESAMRNKDGVIGRPSWERAAITRSNHMSVME